MKKVFDAANAVEAHMVLHMLENHGIDGRIEGEHLSGGVGELPAFGLVRVLVDESDVERARGIIAEWERPQQDGAQHDVRSGPRPATLGAFAMGALLGGLGVFWYYAAKPVVEPGRDFNGDGIRDETLTWRGATPSKAEEDRNADGRIDTRWEFDSQGRVQRQHRDADFDGDMETVTTYRNDLPVYTEVRDARSQADVRHHYLFGVQYYSEIVDRASGAVVKRHTYEGTSLAREEYDADRDGTLETVRTYDDFEEVIATTRQ